MNRDKIRLALAVISGRKTEFSPGDYATLGYDTYKFSYYGAPALDEVRKNAEDIVYYLLETVALSLEDHETR